MNADQQARNDRITNDNAIFGVVFDVGIQRQLDDGDLNEGFLFVFVRLKFTIANPLSKADVSLTLSSFDFR